jgi:hypothetical protein
MSLLINLVRAPAVRVAAFFAALAALARLAVIGGRAAMGGERTAKSRIVAALSAPGS